jgi:hypothetical protein
VPDQGRTATTELHIDTGNLSEHQTTVCRSSIDLDQNETSTFYTETNIDRKQEPFRTSTAANDPVTYAIEENLRVTAASRWSENNSVYKDESDDLVAQENRTRKWIRLFDVINEFISSCGRAYR